MIPLLILLAGCGVLMPGSLEQRLAGHVHVLAADSMEGRGLGTAGILRAAGYVQARLADLGASQPPGWCPPDTAHSRGMPVVNVVGTLGADSAMIALCAHYDHLGMSDHGGQQVPYNGAHDNASGVATVIEAARILLEGQPLRSGLLIAFFSGEEEGLIGSSALLAGAGPEQVRIAICVDAVGHLDSTLLLMGLAGQPLLDSVVSASAAAMRLSRAPALSAGDHASFLARGIPAVGISTGPHVLMNTPLDDPSTLDYAGLAAITRMVVDIVRAVDSLDVMLERPPLPELSRPAPRTARFGTMPDFAHTSAGVRVAGVVPGSPAAAAGILPGDDLISMAGDLIGGPADLARVLKSLAPGDTVVVEYRRQGTSATVRVVLDSRG